MPKRKMRADSPDNDASPEYYDSSGYEYEDDCEEEECSLETQTADPALGIPYATPTSARRNDLEITSEVAQGQETGERDTTIPWLYKRPKTVQKWTETELATLRAYRDSNLDPETGLFNPYTPGVEAELIALFDQRRTLNSIQGRLRGLSPPHNTTVANTKEAAASSEPVAAIGDGPSSNRAKTKARGRSVVQWTNNEIETLNAYCEQHQDPTSGKMNWAKHAVTLGALLPGRSYQAMKCRRGQVLRTLREAQSGQGTAAGSALDDTTDGEGDSGEGDSGEGDSGEGDSGEQGSSDEATSDSGSGDLEHTLGDYTQDTE